MPNDQSRVARRKQQRVKKKPLWKKIMLTIAIICLAIGIGVGGLFTYYIATAPSIDEEKLTDPFSSTFYNKDGDRIGDFGSVERTKIEYDDLPQVLIDAVIATEDARFFKHRGIDLRRIGGAIKANITGGFGSEGASTITQQVVENAFLSPEKKLKFKVQEQWLALRLERMYSKEQILEMYLNKIFYGNNAYGVAKAAEKYFDKDLDDLNLAEAAILAGLPQRPTAYNPYVNPDLTEKRMNTVLNLMVRHGKVSEEEADEARDVDISSLLADDSSEKTPYQGFIQKVRQEVKEKLDADIDTDGLKVYTTLDNDIQEHVEFLLTDSDENPIPYPDDELQTGMVVLDTETGAVRAIGGQRNDDGTDGLNYAFQQSQQPGSTVKPIVAYGPAIEYQKLSTYHQIDDDQPYETGAGSIRNWDRQYKGWMTMRQALTESRNVPTVKLLEETGLNEAKEFAEGLGMEFADDNISIGDAIGGTGTSITPLQLAGSYSAFGNEGIYNEPYTVTKVEYPDGQVVDLKPEPKKVMSDYTAYMITDMLKSVVQEGTGQAANVPNLPVAGKTGTTNLADQEGAPDAWFAGYTTNYTISIWAGGYTDENDNRAPMPEGGTRIPRELFRHTMTEISQGIETPDFEKPDSVVELNIEKGSNPPKIASEHTPSDNTVTELFVKGHEPTETSDTFAELDPVSNLNASYDHDEESIQVTWDYDSDEDVSFTVSNSIDGGQMQKLSTTDEKKLTISDVERGSEYTIQVVAVDDDSNESEPKQAKVLIPDDEDEDEEEDVPPVSNLSAHFNESNDSIEVSWTYDGPDAVFEVNVSPNEQSQTVQSNGIDISGVERDQTYVIEVTPVHEEEHYGDTQTVEVNVPPEDIEEEPEDEPPHDDENEDEENNDDEDNEETIEEQNVENGNQ